MFLRNVRFELFGRDLLDRVPGVARRRCDEDVELAELLDGLLQTQSRTNLSLPMSPASKMQRRPSSSTRRLSPPRRMFVEVDDRDVGALAREKIETARPIPLSPPVDEATLLISLPEPRYVGSSAAGAASSSTRSRPAEGSARVELLGAFLFTVPCRSNRQASAVLESAVFPSTIEGYGPFQLQGRPAALRGGFRPSGSRGGGDPFYVYSKATCASLPARWPRRSRPWTRRSATRSSRAAT